MAVTESAPPTATTRREAVRAALLVAGVAAALRLVWVLWAHVTPFSDFRTYDRIAWDWLQGSAPGSAYRTPGYPAFLAAAYFLFGHSPKAAGIIQALLGGATSGLVVLLAARALSIRTTIIAGLLCAFSPTAIAYTPVLASENLAVPFVVLSLLLLCSAATVLGRARWAFAAGSGAAFGLLLLVRPAGTFMLPGWLAVAVYSPRQRRWRVALPVVAALACALVLAPWLAHTRRLGLAPLKLSTTGGVNLWYGNNPQSTTGGKSTDPPPGVSESGLSAEERDDRYTSAALTWVWQHPGRYAALCRVRLMVLVGCQADPWAAKFLYPTPASDEAMVASYALGQRAPATREQLALGKRTQGRNVWLLTGVRVVVVPLTLLALVLSFQRWRAFALFVWPAAAYTVGLSLTFAKARFRELSEPLLFVPLAALLSDIALGTAEVGTRPSHRVRVTIAILLAGAAVAAHITRYANSWYALPPLR